MFKSIFNPETGETEHVEMSPEEVAELEAAQAEAQAEANIQAIPFRLDAKFKQLPITTQAKLYPLKAALKLALETGEFNVAVEIISSAEVPAELEPVRASLLEEFGVT